jgi:hypothetical protein
MTGNKRSTRFPYNIVKGESVPLRQRTRGLCLLAVYVPLITIPWILTCILAQRPVNATSYKNHRGFPQEQIDGFRYWKNAVDVLNSIAGLITIPLLSALLAQAAVVFCQRTHPEQFLSVLDVFALADRGWTNVAAIWRSIQFRHSKNTSRTRWAGSFLLPAATLILLGALQQPLYQILVHVDTTFVAGCSDTRYQYRSRNVSHCTESMSIAYKPIGVDMEPAQMERIYHNMFLSRVTSSLATVSLYEEQPHLWSDEMSANVWIRSRSSWSNTIDDEYKSLSPWLPGFSTADYELPRFFVAGFPANSTTGVLREHAMRFNSSIQCEEIDRASFPSPCPGERPFSVSLQKANDTQIRVCVPGMVGSFPWTRARSRQDLTEELYLDVWDGISTGVESGRNIRPINATMRCEAKTTRGFFELGNIWNNDTYGSLLDQWPSRGPMLEEFNDWVATSMSGNGFVPTEQYVFRRSHLTLLITIRDDYDGEVDLEPYYTETPSAKWGVSGPLTMSAIALFGNASWLSNVISYTANMTYEDEDDRDTLSWRQICASMPFANLVVNGAGGFGPTQACARVDSSLAAGRNLRPMDLLRLIHEWIMVLAPTEGERKMDMVESLMQISLFTAHQTMLTFYSPNVMGRYGQVGGVLGRTVYSSPGQMLHKPTMSKAALIVLSILIVLQLLGLGYLAYYISYSPTWAGALNALAIAQMGASLGHRNLLPSVGTITKEDQDALSHVNGLIGAVGREDEDEGSQTRLAPDVKSDHKALDIELQEVDTKGPYAYVEQSTATI